MTEEEPQSQKRQLDGGYGWVVVAASTGVMFTLASGFVARGVFLLDFVESFQVTKTEVVLTRSFAAAVGAVFGVFVGTLVTHFGQRRVAVICGIISSAGTIGTAFAPNIYVLYVTNGVLQGFLQGGFGVCTLVAVSQYFDKKKGFAMALRSMGLSAGIFVWPPVEQALSDHYTWRGAMLIIGGLQLNSLVLALLLRPHPASAKDAVKHKWSCKLKELVDYTLLKNPVFMLYIIAVILNLTGHMIPFIFLPGLARSRGISPVQSVWLVSMIGISSFILRPFSGVIVDKLRKYRMLILIISVITAGSLNILISFLHSFTTLAVVSCLMGIFSSNYVVLTPTILTDIVPVHQMATAGGLIGTFGGALGMATGPLSGWLIDVTGNFGTPFLVYGIVQVHACIYFAILVLVKRNRKRKAREKSEAEEQEDKDREVKSLSSLSEVDPVNV